MNRKWTRWLAALLLLPALTGCAGGSMSAAEESVITSVPVPTSVPEQVWKEPEAETAREPIRGLDGTWGYRDPETGEIDILRFEGDTFSVQTATREIGGEMTRDRLYAKSDQEPDLLRLTTGDNFDYSGLSEETGLDLSGKGAPMGEYVTAITICDDEALLYLRQSNNGDAVLPALLPGNGFTYLLHRKGVEGTPGALRLNEIFHAFVWRCDRERGLLWASAAKECDRDESDQPIYTLTGDGQAAEYTVDSELLEKAFQDCADPTYPQGVYRLTVDGNGKVTKIKS